MRLLYGSEWSDREKRGELSDPLARFLILWSPATEAARLQEPVPAQPCAFVHFRFVEEERVPVLYVYELQLAPQVHRLGLGRYLDSVCCSIARAAGMAGVCLTCFKHNNAALKFYSSQGYTEAPHSPGACAQLAQAKLKIISGQETKEKHLVEDEENYIILCKLWDEEAVDRLKEYAEESVQELLESIIAAQNSDDGVSGTEGEYEEGTEESGDDEDIENDTEEIEFNSA
eukprot:CAMPEP_0196574460 /NCGR_PEP_ID=MMETSP1081-20130531/4169_1 /TAXON_ID=36882 /ORGANISM="Pyramimonas amylifera, Strain CCMP720" /LENGTH=229 /DNA_ID=CAMNT_0041892485 /DNA_START=232 /DNA_END=921 /DNA_ORIENTATION=-